jgi:hypothetical protein
MGRLTKGREWQWSCSCQRPCSCQWRIKRLSTLGSFSFCLTNRCIYKSQIPLLSGISSSFTLNLPTLFRSQAVFTTYHKISWSGSTPVHITDCFLFLLALDFTHLHCRISSHLYYRPFLSYSSISLYFPTLSTCIQLHTILLDIYSSPQRRHVA